MRKHGLKALGLCLLTALGIMAFSAVAAQAAEWQVLLLPSNVIDQNIASPIASEKDTTPILLSKVGVNTVEITCTDYSATGNLEAGGFAKATLTFTTCITKVNGVVVPACKPAEPIVAKVIVELFLHSDGLTYQLLSPEGTNFTTISLGSGECPIGKNFEVKGTVVAEDCLHDPSGFLLRHLIQQAVSTTLFPAGSGHVNQLKFGANNASLHGSIWVKLAGGTYSDLDWLGVA